MCAALLMVGNGDGRKYEAGYRKLATVAPPHLSLDSSLTLSPLYLLPHLLFAFTHLCFILLIQWFYEGRKETGKRWGEKHAWHLWQHMPITKLASHAASWTSFILFCFWLVFWIDIIKHSRDRGQRGTCSGSCTKRSNSISSPEATGWLQLNCFGNGPTDGRGYNCRVPLWSVSFPGYGARVATLRLMYTAWF